MNDLITIIVPVYNVESYLDRCMQSILNQTYTNLEIIIIDDNSSDRSREICQLYKKDKRVTIIFHEENKGLSGARNTGLNIAHGKFVAFVDSDDYIESTMIENLYSCMIESNSDTVIGGFRRVIGNKVEVKSNPYAGIVFDNTEMIKENILKKMLGFDGRNQLEMSVWKVLFSMDIIRNNEISFPDRKYLCEDIIFDFDYYPLSKRIAMCNDIGYCYCLNENSLSQKYQKNRLDRIFFQANEMYQRALEIEFDKEAFVRIDNFLIGNILHHMKTMAANFKEIGRKNCLQEYKIAYNNIKTSKIRWDELNNCFNGRDKIPYILMKNGEIFILYVYLRLLTMIRAYIRKY